MAQTKRDYYEILGVAKDADDPALKGAYRKLALQYHPDRNPGNHEAEEKFKEAAEAYSILSDAQKRAAYDRYGHAGVSASGGGPAGFDPNAFQDFSDILGDLFGFGDLFGGGGRRQSNRAYRGEDARYDLELDLADVISGKTVDLQIPRMEPCARCKTTGAEPGGMSSCQTCHGHGDVMYRQGFLSIRRTCPQCGGRGKVIKRQCNECKGEGFKRTEKKMQVSIPPGVSTGNRLVRQGEGQPGINGGPPGDLHIVLRVKDHNVFEREDDDLHCTVPLNIAQAALGADVELLTFDGLQTVKIPEGAQNGSKVKLKGLGVPRLQSTGRGDIYVHVEVRVPDKLSREQRKLLEQLRETLPLENEPKEKGIFEKVKDYFM